MKKSLEASAPKEKGTLKDKKPSSEGPMQARKTLKVLLVDDHKNSLRVMEAVVKGLGHNTKTARSGEEALEIYREGGADLVITDYKMPGMNGVELLEELKRHNPDVKVILVTAYGGILDKEAIVNAGAIDVLGKPMERDDIKNAIDAVSRNQ